MKLSQLLANIKLIKFHRLQFKQTLNKLQKQNKRKIHAIHFSWAELDKVRSFQEV